jgi:predicted MPP superfamily phosphohydrolase
MPFPSLRLRRVGNDGFPAARPEAKLHLDRSAEAASPWRLRRRKLRRPRRTTGKERRWLNPYWGPFKWTERNVDRFAARHVYPHLFGIWHTYCWLLERRFEVAEATIEPPLWPSDAADLRVLLLSDIHAGAFLKPEVLGSLLGTLMDLNPDVVAVAGDIVEGKIEDLDGFLPALSLLARAPLGAWYCHGNHDYYTFAPERIRAELGSIGIRTLRNESVILGHRGACVVVGGIDDRILGGPDWEQLVAVNGPPHLLLAHNPDDFYEAERRRVALVLSGHTHGGQIRFPKGPPLIRQSKFCLDEGLYVHGETLLAVSRGVGAVGLPWRAGAHPEAMLLCVRAPRRPGGAPHR